MGRAISRIKNFQALALFAATALAANVLMLSSSASGEIKSYNNFRTYFSRGGSAVKDLNFNWPEPHLEESQDE